MAPRFMVVRHTAEMVVVRTSDIGAVISASASLVVSDITNPVFFPIIVQLGFDPVWFGILIVVVVEIGLISPPVGMNVFVIKSVVKDVSFTTIFKGVIPFVVTDLLRLLILISFPVIALWLPARMG